MRLSSENLVLSVLCAAAVLIGVTIAWRGRNLQLVTARSTGRSRPALPRKMHFVRWQLSSRPGSRQQKTRSTRVLNRGPGGSGSMTWPCRAS